MNVDLKFKVLEIRFNIWLYFCIYLFLKNLFYNKMRRKIYFKNVGIFGVSFDFLEYNILYLFIYLLRVRYCILV